MASYKDKTGFSPKCPYCDDDQKGFAVAFDEHTVGNNGQYEIVCCRSCHKVISMQSYPDNQR